MQSFNQKISVKLLNIQNAHHFLPETLNLNKIMSPSSTTYYFPF
jgi:hypothetical protein